MYQFVDKQERNALAKTCEDIIFMVQKQMKEYFTFKFFLIGSGERKLITKNGIDGSFDLDYDIILQRDKKELTSYPEKIKNLFIQALNQINPKFGFKFANDSTSVITSRLILNKELVFSFDIAILIEGNNGNLYKLVFDKKAGKYLWNELPQSRDYSHIFQKIKTMGQWNQFKTRYLELKNLHLCRGDHISSFPIFLEAINEFRNT